jgi:hypothetical protein
VIRRFVFDATAAPVMCDDLGAVFRKNFVIQSIAIVGLVSDDSLGQVGRKAIFDRLAYKGHFSRGSTRCAKGDRKTMAVRYCHDLVPFPRLVFPTQRPLF